MSNDPSMHPLIRALGSDSDVGRQRRLFAILRRSLVYPPGEDLRAIGVIETIVQRALSQEAPKRSSLSAGTSPEEALRAEAAIQERKRRNAYLVAGLMGLAGRAGPNSGEDLGRCLARFRGRRRGSDDAVERRLAQLVEADQDQLPTRLRSVIQLLLQEDIVPDFSRLLRDLNRWNTPSRQVQRRWLRSYYAAEPNEATNATQAAIDD